MEENAKVVKWELELLDRALTVLQDLLTSEDEGIRLQAAKTVIRLVEVMPPPALLATSAERADAEKWRSWYEKLDGIADDAA